MQREKYLNLSSKLLLGVAVCFLVLLISFFQNAGTALEAALIAMQNGDPDEGKKLIEFAQGNNRSLFIASFTFGTAVVIKLCVDYFVFKRGGEERSGAR